MRKSEHPQPPADGVVFWVTGLSGAGKTTVSTELAARIRAAGRPALLLDGDVLRTIFPRADGMGLDERRNLAQAYGRLCHEVSRQGIDVVCATISMFHEVHDWNRANIPRYLEVLLDVPREELRRRDAKGIYARLDAGTESNVVGFDVPAELPRNPDLRIANFDLISVKDTVDRILGCHAERFPDV